MRMGQRPNAVNRTIDTSLLDFKRNLGNHFLHSSIRPLRGETRTTWNRGRARGKKDSVAVGACKEPQSDIWCRGLYVSHWACILGVYAQGAQWGGLGLHACITQASDKHESSLSHVLCEVSWTTRHRVRKLFVSFWVSCSFVSQRAGGTALMLESFVFEVSDKHVHIRGLLNGTRSWVRHSQLATNPSIPAGSSQLSRSGFVSIAHTGWVSCGREYPQTFDYKGRIGMGWWHGMSDTCLG